MPTNYFDQSINRTGANNGGSDKRALMLKVFSGEILANYSTKTILANLVRTRTISGGKSATFPIYGKASAKWHTPGQNILEAANGMLSDFKYGERVIAIDNMLTASTLIHDVDELLQFWDVRGPIATELGYALARAYDGMAMRTFIAASLATSPISNTSGNGTALAGETITTGSTGSVTGAQVVDSMFSAQEKLDNKDVPTEGRFVILRPEQFNAVLATAQLTTGNGTSTVNGNFARFNKDYNTSLPADLGKGTASSLELAGFRVYKSNLFPRNAGDQTKDSVFAAGDGTTGNVNGNIANDPFGSGNGYGYDFSKYWGIMGHADAIGVVKKLDVATEMERKIEYQGTLVVSKLMAGFGVLRPECAIGCKWT
jgi:hypothetical protein